MEVKFLDLQKITAKYSEQMHEAVLRVVDSGWYLQGHENEKFEANYAKYIGAEHAIGCANGLDALIWIFRAYIEMGVMQPAMRLSFRQIHILQQSLQLAKMG